MRYNQLGPLWPVSEIALGGAGIAQVWGETDRDEGIKTACLAVESGVTLFDVAPMYGRGEAEMVIGEAFQGLISDELHFSTKCLLGTQSAEQIVARLEKSVQRSVATMKLEAIDLLFLHSQIIPDNYSYPAPIDEQQHNFAVTLSCYYNIVVPAFERLKAQGLIKAWGITGSGLPEAIMQVLSANPKPAVVQVITNLLDSPGEIKRYPEPAQPRDVLATALAEQVGVLGIRAVQGGALTHNIDRPLPDDHPVVLDYQRSAPFRKLCSQWGRDPADVAHNYALAMPGVDSVVLGVKNRQELQGILNETTHPISADEMKAIDDLGLRQV